MEDDILRSTKKILGISSDYTAFDQDIIVHINSAIGTLSQLGIGPAEGFSISGEGTSWSEFTNDDAILNMCQSYIYLRVKLLFDPPSTSFALDAMKQQIEEFEQRISYHREWMLDPVDPKTLVPPPPDPNREYWYIEGVMYDG